MTAAELGPYRLGPSLGSGGMGEVYRAWDTRRSRWVALKLLHPRFSADAGYRARFRREAEAAADLREPHVVPVHDFGEIDGQLYLDMRLIDGTDLGTLLRDGPLEPRRAVALVTQVAAALDAAHAAGLVHRDVKASNVLVGPGDFAYLADFGIARAAGPATDSEDGTVIGTLASMAPERLRGEPADARSDVYSLACLLYECLTGGPPFGDEDASVLVAAHLYRAPLTDALPAALGDVVARGMAKHPEARHAGAGAFAADAAAALRRRPTARLEVPERGPEPPPPDTVVAIHRWSPGTLWPQSRWVRRTLVVALVALLVVAGVAAVRRYVGTGISIGISPVAVAFTATGDAVIANAGSRTVTVFDTRGRTIAAEIPLGNDRRTVGAVADPAGERLYVATTRGAGDALVTVDLGRSTVTAALPLPEPPVGAPVVDAGGTAVFVPVRGGIAVVDPAAGRIVGRLDRTATGLAAHDATRLVTVDERRSTAELVDVRTGATAGVIPLGAPAHLAVAAPAGTAVYLGSRDPEHALTVVDPGRATPVAEVPLPGPVAGMAVSPDGEQVFVAIGTDPPVLAAVDTATREVRTGWFLEEYTGDVAMAVSPDGTEVYIANIDLGTLTIDDVSRPPE
ncbi:serine/threonine-protein kinase [Actinomycetospora flava]|uniref:non-specific serine/threonine protein kinase n=1 Tax=Actinomycetospora flava TaxID=3129232 RepID=A0ABU8M9E8_9PSEU